MGACDFRVRSRAKSMGQAYDKAVSEAIYENGNDSYNGTISTTHGCIDKTKDFKASGQSLNEYIADKVEDMPSRGSAWGICLKEPKQNKNKIKTRVEHHVTKGTKKWELLYVVTEYNEDRIIKTEKTKAAAIKAARKHTEDKQVKTYINMEKRLVSGSSLVAHVEYKRSDKEQDGEYIFFGVAAF